MTIDTSCTEGHVLGNFHAYYSFNPAHERLRFIDASTAIALRRALLQQDGQCGAEPATIMDIGCNEGDLTLGLYKSLIGQLDPFDSGGVDVVTFDGASVSKLNEFAQKNKKTVNYQVAEEGGSKHRPRYVCDLHIDGVSVATSAGVSKKVAKSKAAWAALQIVLPHTAADDANSSLVSIGTDAETLEVANRKRLCVLGVDVDEELIARASAKAVGDDLHHDDVVDFLCANVTEDGFESSVDEFLHRVGRVVETHQIQPGTQVQPRRPFDLITLFSVTMWIHLNHGDEGLWKFLDAVAKLTEHLIVEPQPWKCYRNAIYRLGRHCATIPASFSSLQVRQNVLDKMDTFLLDTGRFQLKAELGKTNWSRPIRLYSRRPIDGVAYTEQWIGGV